MTRRPGGSDGPEDVDAAFAEIVAALEREGVGASLVELEGSVEPDRPDRPSPRGDHPEPRDPDPTEPGGMPVVKGPPTPNPPTLPAAPVEPTPEPAPNEPVTPWRGTQVPWDAEPEEHFVPPEPPPLPRLRPGTVFGLLLMLVGVFLLAAPNVIGLAPRIATPLALVSIATGIGWLVLRMRHGPPSEDDTDGDDGAQV